MRTIASRTAVLALAAVAVIGQAHGQSYPAKPIRMIVPYAAGGANDIRGRIVADKLTQSLGKQVIVENKPGADGSIGSDLVAKSAPDGYTLLLTVHGTVVANPALFKRIPYDPVTDFEHITQLITTTVILAVNASLPVNSVKELIAYAKARPGQLNYATAVSSYYLITEMFKARAGVNMVYVPYKGDAPAVMALVSGETPVMFDPILPLLPQIKANKVRPLAVASAARSPVFPDLPTMAEAGLPGFEASTFTGFAAPAGTPKDIIKRLHGDIVKIARMPDVRERLESGGDTIIANTPEEFTAYIKAEVERYRNLVRDAGIPRIDQ